MGLLAEFRCCDSVLVVIVLDEAHVRQLRQMDMMQRDSDLAGVVVRRGPAPRGRNHRPGEGIEFEGDIRLHDAREGLAALSISDPIEERVCRCLLVEYLGNLGRDGSFLVGHQPSPVGPATGWE